MIKQVFINLPVADLQASMAFFNALGFSLNPQTTDDTDGGRPQPNQKRTPPSMLPRCAKVAVRSHALVSFERRTPWGF
jgi:hypothetical protein